MTCTNLSKWLERQHTMLQSSFIHDLPYFDLKSWLKQNWCGSTVGIEVREKNNNHIFNHANRVLVEHAGQCISWHRLGICVCCVVCKCICVHQIIPKYFMLCVFFICYSLFYFSFLLPLSISFFLWQLGGCGILGVGVWLSVTQGNFATLSSSLPSLSAANLLIAVGTPG